MNQDLRMFSAVVIAVFLEAAPFLMLGALLSALVEVHLPQEWIEKHVPKGRFSGLLFGLSAGMLIPTCECGVVAIVRRLLRKGVPSHVAMTYMLSAPVINPLVLASTYIAYRGDLWMVLSRVGLVAASAAFVGLGLASVDPVLLLREGKIYRDLFDRSQAEHSHSEVHPPHHACSELPHGCACGCESDTGSKFIRVLQHAASEFLDMGKYLILGAFVVGLSNVFLPQAWLVFFESNVFLAIGGMMLLAVLLSVCSEADAFVAASFSSFPRAAQLSFLAIGPMVDLKLIVMYAAVFHRRVALMLILVPTILTFILSSLLGLVIE
jgi:uncharacterized membrane protein YraQ (UPF0718 family)